MLKVYNIRPVKNPNELKVRDYSDYEKWDFTCDTEKFKGWICSFSGYDIKKCDSDNYPVNYKNYAIWKQYIIDWINENNQRIYNGDLNGREIIYKMLDVDEDSAYTYEKYVDGHLAKTGKGWLKDLEYKFEKEAWREGIKEFKKARGIKTESDKMKEKQEETNKKIKDMDSSLPETEEQIPPTLINAIAKATDAPCEFISEIISKGVMGVTGVSFKELFNYYTKIIKKNITTEAYRLANSATALVETYYKPVEEKIVDMTDYFAQLDTDREEYLKLHSDDVCLFKLVEEEYAIKNSTSTSSTSSTTSTTSTVTNVQTTQLPSNYSKVKGSPHFAAGATEKDYVDRKQGTLEWNKKQPNENVITNESELWKIVRKDLGNKPYGEEADASMCSFKVNVRDKNGVIVQRKVTVHKAAVGTFKKIFEELLNIPTFKEMQGYLDTYSFRCVSQNKKPDPDPNKPYKPKSLSKHAYGIAIDINPWKWGDNPNHNNTPGEIEKFDESDNTDTTMRTFNHPIVKAFRKFAFGWGGGYSDYMHFSANTYYKKIKNHGDKCFTGR